MVSVMSIDENATSPNGPLSGVRVLEVSSVVMAPMAGRIMAKLGASVIRVEPPQGDVIRRTGASRHEGMTGAALALGDGKLAIALDLRTDEGRAELADLIVTSDVVITNHLPRRRPGFGLDWDSVRQLNERAILCTAQGYASDSANADTPAYDDTVQAASGVCDIYAKSDGSPRYAPYIMADKICGLTIVYSILAALHYRSHSSKGQWVDVPMVDVMADFNLIEQLNDYTFQPALGEAGWHRTLAPARKPHATRDGWVCVLPYTDQNWRDFLRVAGFSDGSSDQVPFRTNRERNAHSEAVQGIIADYAAVRTTEQVVRECAEIRVPVQPVKSVESLLEDDYLRSRRTVELIDHPSEGAIWRSSPNIGFSASPLHPVRPASNVDQDREEVLRKTAHDGKEENFA